MVYVLEAISKRRFWSRRNLTPIQTQRSIMIRYAIWGAHGTGRAAPGPYSFASADPLNGESLQSIGLFFKFGFKDV